MKKYSDWFKVDLHIHTDFSNKIKINDYDGVFDLEVLKLRLIENDVKLFSLTDHNIINNAAYENYYNEYQQGDPILLVGCEFDIRVEQNDKSFLTYHTLLIFNESSFEKANELSSIIESHFLKNNIPNSQRSLTEDEIFELFHTYHFFYIPHAGGHKNIIDAYKGADIKKAQQMVLLMESAHEKVKEVHRIKHLEGFDKLKDPAFQNKADEAFINFSDNHNCHNYPIPKSGIPHEFYCIKGQPTFESIRFAFIDPKSRIKKYTEVEVLMRFDNFLHSVQFDGNPIIKDATIYFSPNLNTIIGGRSSGKSLLFNILGKKINNKKSQIDNYGLLTSNAKVKGFLDDDYKPVISYNTHDIIYINQGEIVNYFENNSLKDLIQESGKTENYKISLEVFKTKKQNLNDLIDKLIELYSELHEVLNSNFTFHDRDIISILDSSYIFKIISDIEDKANSFQTSVEILNLLLDNIEKFKSNENWAFSSGEIDTIKAFKELVESKNNLFENTKNDYIKKENFIELVKQIIFNKNANLDLKGREKESSSQRLTTLNKNIADAFKIAMQVQIHCSIFESLSYGGIQEIKINDEVTVVLEVESKESIKAKILEGLSVNTSDNLSLYQVFIKLALGAIKIKNFPENSPENLIKKIQTQIRGILDLFDRPIEYLKYSEESTSKNNSPGFNSEKYLETILRNGNSKIIFIDQPEDNLGNKFITDKLINIIRELKFKKQIFLVTHNPSIVVYGDAENIILCTNSENTIEYEQFVLEDKEHQKEICNVLDGGQYIFEQRARKYNIQKLIQ